MNDNDDSLRSVSDAADKLQHEREEIANGTKRWGRWRFDPPTDTLVCDITETAQYQVPLDRCRGTAAELLGWIAQVSDKSWASENDLGHFVRALKKTVGLRGRN